MNTNTPAASPFKSGLPSFMNLLRELFAEFKLRALSLIVILIASMGAGAFVIALLVAVIYGATTLGAGADAELAISGMGTVVVGLIALSVVVFGIVLQAVSTSALVHATLHKATIKESIMFGLKMWKSVLWVNLLSGLIIMGGFVPLVIPGIILGVLLSFGMYATVEEGKKGMAAVMRSRELVKGRWWVVLGISLGIGILIGIPSGILNMFGSEDAYNLANGMADAYSLLVATPAMLLLSAIMYRHLKAKPMNAAGIAPTGLYKGLAIWGVLASVIAAVVIGGSLMFVASYMFSGDSIDAGESYNRSNTGTLDGL